MSPGNYFDKSEVEKVLDVMALHKLNVFHWHLVDDQGWRIEIKKYPKLTEEAAWRSGIGFDLDPKRSDHYRADGKYGGFYTQDDIREVVAYAAARHIMIVPGDRNAGPRVGGAVGVSGIFLRSQGEGIQRQGGRFIRRV